MKKIISLILVLAVLLSCVICVFAQGETMSVYSSYKIPSGTMRMIAHTGYSAVAPGNTLHAYEAAGKSDFWGAECDIQRTKDGVWILMHNDTVDEMTDGTGRVADLTFDEIRELTVDSGNNIDKYPGTKIATLTEYLDVCGKYGLYPVIEIKANAEVGYMDELASLLSAREDKSMFAVISFGREICVRMKELLPEIPVYYLIGYEGVSREDIDFALDNHLDGMDIHVFLPDDYVKEVVDSGLDVFVWTIDDIENAERFYEFGVNAITTNSLTQEKPSGSIEQKIKWAWRDLKYFFNRFFETLSLRFTGKAG